MKMCCENSDFMNATKLRIKSLPNSIKMTKTLRPICMAGENTFECISSEKLCSVCIHTYINDQNCIFVNK